jgi:hypothetical protein
MDFGGVQGAKAAIEGLEKLKEGLKQGASIGKR